MSSLARVVLGKRAGGKPRDHRCSQEYLHDLDLDLDVDLDVDLDLDLRRYASSATRLRDSLLVVVYS